LSEEFDLKNFKLVETHRGIKTTLEPKNELEPVTKINRFGHKTLSLPRIDDKKRWSGFPGLTGWARKLARMIPKCEWYVEPFCGMGKVFQELIKLQTARNYILNDKSSFINKWLWKEFSSEALITQQDFLTCIKEWDSKDTVFLIDQPWFKSYYDQIFSVFDRSSVMRYDEEILTAVKQIKGKFIITSRKENVRMLRSGYNHKLIKSEYVVSGKYPKLLLTTNLRLHK